jgi:hypothetical protein
LLLQDNAVVISTEGQMRDTSVCGLSYASVISSRLMKQGDISFSSKKNQLIENITQDIVWSLIRSVVQRAVVIPINEVKLKYSHMLMHVYPAKVVYLMRCLLDCFSLWC